MKCVACYSTVVYMFYRRLPSTITEFFLRVHFKKGEIRAASPCLSVCVCTHTTVSLIPVNVLGGWEIHVYLQSKEFSF